MNEEVAKKWESNGELWRDKRAKFENRPLLYADTISKNNAITLDVTGDYFRASTSMSYESARELAQWILDIADRQREPSKEEA